MIIAIAHSGSYRRLLQNYRDRERGKWRSSMKEVRFLRKLVTGARKMKTKMKIEPNSTEYTVHSLPPFSSLRGKESSVMKVERWTA